MIHKATKFTVFVAVHRYIFILQDSSISVFKEAQNHRLKTILLSDVFKSITMRKPANIGTKHSFYFKLALVLLIHRTGLYCVYRIANIKGTMETTN